MWSKSIIVTTIVHECMRPMFCGTAETYRQTGSTFQAARKRSIPFHLRKATFKGEELQEGVKDSAWEQIRELAYEGRGG